ncbi:Cobyrinic acid A,C-diamide synthase [Thalassoporum mexicanum PCC 7367]|uniref:cobyrinate a,c-diamide synthase n=1 Tax=Thalassoporum mexicanum TaxID=3457544 RepID=UPI00029FED57|nr:cobyrinate a,c-diamide synthase [Pseudanabaena sp. PCC 7367]AFY70193.1 Cobyrinic acid A,C-diamide synthase [Pseudanabaena sp. PCC 7367]
MAIAIAGTHSGVGKTTVTLAILAALQRWGQKIQSFKVGPDYIDPMFHGAITGRSCRNLDPVLTSNRYVQACFTQHSAIADGAVIEGVMGLFDGAASSEVASTAQVVKLLNHASKQISNDRITSDRKPAVSLLLVIDCAKMSRSLAALVYGYANFDPDLQIAGIILNQVGSDRHKQVLSEAIAPLHIPIVGVIPRQVEIKLSDRHLGLVPTEEVGNFNQIVDRLAELGKTCFDWDKLLPLVQTNSEQLAGKHEPIASCDLSQPKSPARIAVARDRAFNFYYADNLDLLKSLGAELLFWSPLKDQKLPEGTTGLYLGGGFPEMFAAELSANQGAIASIQQHTHLPIYAECGGLMYLSESITNFAGETFPMVGVLPTQTVMAKKLTLGYRRCALQDPNNDLSDSKTYWGHEFHRSQLTIEPTEPVYKLANYAGEAIGFDGWRVNRAIATYTHFHWGDQPELASFLWGYV